MSTMSLDRANALSAAKNRAIGLIASGVGLPEVLDELCRTIDVLTPGVVSTVLRMDPDGKRLWTAGGPAFPTALRPAIAADPGVAPEWSARDRTHGCRCGCRLRSTRGETGRTRVDEHAGRMKLVGGELSITSQPGAGTTVRVRVSTDRVRAQGRLGV
jgi:hypothetical protein